MRERVVMEPGREIAALRVLRDRLEANQVVSISVSDEATQTVGVPFLGGELRLASGPMPLASVTGAPLLPVFTIRTAVGELQVEVQRPLDDAVDVDRNERFADMARQYARRLEPYVQQYPGQWLG